MKRHIRIVVFSALLVLAWQVSSAQEQTTCPAVVEVALAQMADNCENLARNSACYGYDRVTATFMQPVSADFFSQPSDRVELVTVQSIQTAPLDTALNQWGIAVMNVQANVPETLPGQAVTFILMGNAMIENYVSAEEADTTFQALPVSITSEAVIRSAPSADGTVLGTLGEGTSLLVDGVDDSHEYVRTYYLDQHGWVHIDALEASDELLTLTAPGERGPSPMQAFYFTTSVSAPICNQAPDVLTIHAPENVTVDLTVNGANIRVGSTLTFKQVSEEALVMSVHEGHAELLDQDVTVDGGEMILALIDPSSQSITEWGEPAVISPSQANLGQVAEQALEGVLPDLDLEFSASADAVDELIHIVQPGENLFRIALLYEASMPAIVSRNNLPDPRTLRVGQALIIPNPGSGFVGLDLEEEANTLRVTPTVVDCSRFRPTSPLEGLSYGINTFYWDPAPGATSYRVVVYNNTEPRSVYFDAPGNATSVSGAVDQMTVGGGFSFSWEVLAFYNGQQVCSGGLNEMLREAGIGSSGVVPPPVVVPPPPVPVLTANWTCGAAPGQMTITFSGALATDTITISYTRTTLSGTVVITTPVTIIRTGSAGSHTDSPGTSADYFSRSITTSSGQSVVTPGTLTCP